MTTHVAHATSDVKLLVANSGDARSQARQHRCVSTLLERLEETVRISGMGQTDLALAAGLSHGYLGTLMARLRKDPDAGIDGMAAAKLAKAAGVSADWLLGSAQSPARPACNTHPRWGRLVDEAVEVSRIDREVFERIGREAPPLWLRVEDITSSMLVRLARIIEDVESRASPSR